MPVSKEQLAAIIGGRAREMCSVENDKKLNAMAGRVGINEGYFDDPDPYSYDDGGAADKFDAMCGFGVSNDGGVHDMRYNATSAAGSRMPDNIKQSMLSEQIDVSRLGNTSVLDSMSIPPKQQKTQQRTRQINETVQYATPQGGIDYSIIKAIVTECIDAYFAKKQPLNESASLSTIGLKNGKITLVDNSGNVYSAELKKVGNKNEKK